jgi:hypothetical protein
MYFLQGNMSGAWFGHDWASLFHVATTHYRVMGGEEPHKSNYSTDEATDFAMAATANATEISHRTITMPASLSPG